MVQNRILPQFHLGRLWLHVHAAKHHRAAQLGVLGIEFDLLCDLIGQLAGGQQHQSTHRVASRRGGCVFVLEQALQQLASEWIAPHDLNHVWVTDGDLLPQDWTLEQFQAMEDQVWGAGFAAPLFCAEWRVCEQRLVGEKHLQLKLRHQGQPVDGIWFNRVEPLPPRAKLAFRLDADEWQGQKRVRFLIEAAEL